MDCFQKRKTMWPGYAKRHGLTTSITALCRASRVKTLKCITVRTVGLRQDKIEANQFIKRRQSPVIFPLVYEHKIDRPTRIWLNALIVISVRFFRQITAASQFRKRRNCSYITLKSETVQANAKVTIECKYEVICDLSIVSFPMTSVISNDLEWTLTWVSRSIYFSKANIPKRCILQTKMFDLWSGFQGRSIFRFQMSKTVQDRAIVTNEH